MLKVVTKAITFLPEGRPYLLESSGTLDLIYLSWGRRRYGESPVPATPHEGWVCTLILEGSPSLIFSAGRSATVLKNQIVVSSPECATGWTDQNGCACEQLTWLWRRPFKLARAIGWTRDFLILRVEEDAIARFRHIHQRCREEVSAPDQFTSMALRALHQSLQVELERTSSKEGHARSATRYEFAIAWLERHWSDHRAVSRLAEYLQVSISTLDRLFKKNGEISVAEWIHHRKMSKAESLLRGGAHSKKQIAYELGYRHPCDFSRAWSNWQIRKK